MESLLDTLFLENYDISVFLHKVYQHFLVQKRSGDALTQTRKLECTSNFKLTAKQKCQDHRLITKTDKTPDVVFSRFRDFSFTKTLR